METTAQPDLNIIDFESLTPLPYDATCITIGNFDGVHRGHQAIIQRMLEKARPRSYALLVVTFYPNPSVFFTKNDSPYYLSTPGEKERQLLTLGVDRVITFRFNQEFAALTPEAFVEKLKQALGLRVLVVGQDFALGKNRLGTIPYLKNLGKD